MMWGNCLAICCDALLSIECRGIILCVKISCLAPTLKLKQQNVVQVDLRQRLVCKLEGMYKGCKPCLLQVEVRAQESTREHA